MIEMKEAFIPILLSVKKMDLSIFAINQEQKELEICDFHHSTENSVNDKSV
jgi:hypothetical protein